MVEIWEVVRQHIAMVFIVIIGTFLPSLRKETDSKSTYKHIAHLIISATICLLAERYVRQYLNDYFYIVIFAIAVYSVEIVDYMRGDFLLLLKRKFEKWFKGDQHNNEKI